MTGVSPKRLALLIILPLGGCSDGVFDPQGPVAAAEQIILADSLAIMFAIVVPTILATLGMAWWFRASAASARYLPDWDYSGRIEMVVWSIPAMTVLLLSGICWIGSHELDPSRPLSGAKPLRVQVVALDWKWLFILPDQGVASVNHLVVPVGIPLRLELTSAGVMNGFIVPQLGSQIAVMPRMRTELNLRADRAGTYPGLSTNFSGSGFADMGFTIEAITPDRFNEAIAAVQGHGPILDERGYDRLAEPGVMAAPLSYGTVAPELFQRILAPEGICTPSSVQETR